MRASTFKRKMAAVETNWVVPGPARKPRKPKAPGPSEDAIQIQTIQLLRLKLDPSVLCHHSPNGGKRSAREAARFKAMGCRAGWSDLVFVWPNSIECAPTPDGKRVQAVAPRQAFIEMKSAKGVLTEPQREFFRQLAELGIPHAVCRSSAEVLERLEEWGVPMRSFR